MMLLLAHDRSSQHCVHYTPPNRVKKVYLEHVLDGVIGAARRVRRAHIAGEHRRIERQLLAILGKELGTFARLVPRRFLAPQLLLDSSHKYS